IVAIVRINDIDDELRQLAEPLLQTIFDPLDAPNLILSRTCAHVLIEGIGQLDRKEAEKAILSSSTIVLKALLIGRQLAEPGVFLTDEHLGGEWDRLRDWGA